jgi:glyceraldehyde-3-phosphate dehydrogenase/erythrose-4-phosphate dehydrogenase
VPALDSILVGRTPVATLYERDPAAIDWGELGVDVVIESVGLGSGAAEGILRYIADALVSWDIIGDPASCALDSSLTQAASRLAKVFGWYDNEWGYTCGVADLAGIVGRQLERAGVAGSLVPAWPGERL